MMLQFTTAADSYRSQAITSVRYLNFNVKYNMQRMETELKEAGLVSDFRTQQLAVDVVRCVPLAEFLTDKLASDPYYLLDSPPEFVKGIVPFDGNAGPENPQIANVKYSRPHENLASAWLGDEGSSAVTDEQASFERARNNLG